MATIHQFLAGFNPGDAISNEALVIRDIFRSWGHQSEIFCETKRIEPRFRNEAREVTNYPRNAAPEDIVLLHLSIGSIANRVFVDLPCRKAILYHNVTPPEFYQTVNTGIAFNLANGIRDARALAQAAEVNMACSRFSAREMEDMGYRDVKLLPLILDFSHLEATPDRGTLARFTDGKINVLFVGRGAPNKRIEDALKAFYYYHKYVNAQSRFVHVGSYNGTESYRGMVDMYAKNLDLVHAVHIAGAVDQKRLNAFYRSAHVFLCTSEHEGFCIPLIESMFFDLPVLAYAAAAVPETLDGAGVCFKEKQYDQVGEMIGRLAADTPFRESVLKGQSERLARFRDQDLESTLRQHLAPLLP